MRTYSLFRICIPFALLAGVATSTSAQTPEPETRQAVLEGQQTQKSAALEPYVPSKGERLIDRVENVFVYPTQTWHPFFENAYRGGGFAAGLGYMWHVSPYSYVDIRGSYSIKSYKRAEIEFVSPRLFHRRGELSLLGAAGATPPRSASTDSAWTRLRTIARTTASSARPVGAC